MSNANHIYGIGYTCFIGRTSTKAPVYVSFPALPDPARPNGLPLRKKETLAASVLVRGLFTQAGGVFHTAA